MGAAAHGAAGFFSMKTAVHFTWSLLELLSSARQRGSHRQQVSL